MSEMNLKLIEKQTEKCLRTKTQKKSEGAEAEAEQQKTNEKCN